MTKKILFINSNIAWGGGEKWHYQMAHALLEQSYTVSVMTNESSELYKKLKSSNIRCQTLKLNNLSFLNPFKLYQSYKILREEQPDVIVLNLPRDVKIFAPLAKLIRRPKVIYRRGMPKDLKRNIINQFIYKYVDLFVANSSEIKRSIIQNFPEFESKVKIITNGVTPKTQKTNSLKSPIVLGNLGRLVEQKGQEHLINIAKILQKENFNFELIIAGVGPLKEHLQEKIKAFNLNKEVKLMGLMDSDDFFEKIDLFLFSSHFEGSANALIEAHNNGKPSIAFDISSNAEVLQNSRSGFLINPFDEKEFANKIKLLAQDKELYEQFSKECHKVITEKFDYSKKIEEFLGVINA